MPLSFADFEIPCMKTLVRIYNFHYCDSNNEPIGFTQWIESSMNNMGEVFITQSSSKQMITSFKTYAEV